MGITTNAGNADPDGAQGLPAGVYHVVVEGCAVEGNKVKLVLQCLAGRTAAGDTTACVGSRKTEFLEFGATEDWKERRLWTAAYALGLVTMEQWKACFEQKVTTELPLDNCRGAQMCIEIQRRPGKEGTKNQGKMFDNITGMWPLSSAEASNVPKDMAWAQAAQQQALARGQAPAAPAAPAQPQAPVASPAAPVAPPPQAPAVPPAQPGNLYAGF